MSSMISTNQQHVFYVFFKRQCMQNIVVLEIIFKSTMFSNVVIRYILRNTKMGSKLRNERYQEFQYILILP